MDKTVKKEDESAGTQGVERDAEGSTAKELSKEDIAEMAEALESSLKREAKTAEERDNYKEGMLKAKGKLKSDGKEEEEDTEPVNGKGKDSSELAVVVKELLKQNKELTVAAVNRSQIATSGQGGSSESKVEVGDNLLSTAQLKDLKSRGWDDKKIARLKENLQKTRG